ncbi:hypothetical protein [Pantoea sp. JKS000250]|uniref:hypothetical protein n=1 Tax=Pantoea sp. JKS000250 TaxID=1938795 RepID=UPI000D76AEA8|nr:hypothetical protein [Pantoea sp. JKS000250]PXW19042.1 hypothetical protein BY447_0609 [Pantoea sp. JKS000250]
MTHPDPIDEAAEREQQMIEIALANRRHPEMSFTDTCYYCEEAVTAGCFCSTECREDHERVEHAKQHRRVE